MKSEKVALVNDPSMISQARIPSKDSAGRIEYLEPVQMILRKCRDGLRTFALEQRSCASLRDVPSLRSHDSDPDDDHMHSRLQTRVVRVGTVSQCGTSTQLSSRHFALWHFVVPAAD
jgi:hypothetical protein